jgi:septal ring-binding cell division protein DamX
VAQPILVESPKASTEPALASATEKVAPQTNETRPALPLVETALPSSPIPTQATVPGKTDRPVVEETIITETATESRPSASGALSADSEWLRRLSSDHFVIAHGTFRKLENAQKLRAKHVELNKSRIVPILVSKKVAYAVITGPFRNEDRANNNLKKLSWASKAKVLSVQRTQKLMAAAQKSSRAKP